MTDSRLPGRWLTDLRFDELSDRAFRTFCGSLMWSNEQGTDGSVPNAAMRYLHPQGVDAATRMELFKAKLWVSSDGGVQVLNWTDTQSRADDVRAKREGNRLRQQKHRAGKRTGVDGSSVTRDVTDDVTGESLGQDRRGEDRTGKEISEAPDAENSNVLEWSTRKPGTPAVVGDEVPW